MTAVLIGVGVGPGDPELMTLRALRILRESDTVVVPVMEGGGSGYAEEVVKAWVDGSKVVRVGFALDDRGGVTDRRLQAWDRAARIVVEAFEGGDETIAFATLGDPNVYSTFTYLSQTVRRMQPHVEVQTVPGITAMQDLAARSGVVLCEGKETVTLLPGTAGLDAVEAALDRPGTVVAYKGWRMLPQLTEALRRRGRLDDAVVGSKLGLADECVTPASEAALHPMEYLATLLAPARRQRRGGKL